jgi:hypothetical protein
MLQPSRSTCPGNQHHALLQLMFERHEGRNVCLFYQPLVKHSVVLLLDLNASKECFNFSSRERFICRSFLV